MCDENDSFTLSCDVLFGFLISLQEVNKPYSIRYFLRKRSWNVCLSAVWHKCSPLWERLKENLLRSILIHNWLTISRIFKKKIFTVGVWETMMRIFQAFMTFSRQSSDKSITKTIVSWSPSRMMWGGFIHQWSWHWCSHILLLHSRWSAGLGYNHLLQDRKPINE